MVAQASNVPFCESGTPFQVIQSIFGFAPSVCVKPVRDAVLVGCVDPRHRHGSEIVERVRQRGVVVVVKSRLDNPFGGVAEEVRRLVKRRTAVDATRVERARRKIEAGGFIDEPERRLDATRAVPTGRGGDAPRRFYRRDEAAGSRGDA